MSDLDILKEMIKDTATVSLVDNNYGKKQVILTEPQHPDSVVIISGMPANAIVIKADAFKSLETVFNGSHGECKRADFVIIVEEKKVILFIEMKATRDSEKEIIQQLTGAQCFVAFCREIGKTFWKQQDFLDNYQYRFISIGQISVDKQKTRIIRPNRGIHDRPDKMLKIAWPHHLQFKHLI